MAEQDITYYSQDRVDSPAHRSTVITPTDLDTEPTFIFVPLLTLKFASSAPSIFPNPLQTRQTAHPPFVSLRRPSYGNNCSPPLRRSSGSFSLCGNSDKDHLRDWLCWWWSGIIKRCFRSMRCRFGVGSSLPFSSENMRLLIRCYLHSYASFGMRLRIQWH